MKDTVLLISTLFPNSQFPQWGIYTLQICQQLSKICDLKIIAPVPYFPRWKFFKNFNYWYKFSQIPAMEKISGLRVYHPRYLIVPGVSINLLGISMFLAIFGLIRRWSKNKAVSAINAHYLYPDGLAAVLAAKLLKVPVVLSALGSDVNLNSRFYLPWAQSRWAIAHCQGLTSVSQALKDRLAELGIASQKVKVVPNGIDKSRFFPVSKEWARKQLNLPSHYKIILFIGSFDEFPDQRISIKGIEYLIEALTALRENFTRPFSLFLIGNGALLPKMKELAKTLGVEDICFFLGQKSHEQIPLWIGACDLLCRPTLIEGMPNVVLEALACGRPVVGSNIGAIPQLLSEENGLLVSAQDAAGLAFALKLGLEKTWNEQRIVSSVSQFTWQQSAQGYWEQIKKAMKYGDKQWKNSK